MKDTIKDEKVVPKPKAKAIVPVSYKLRIKITEMFCGRDFSEYEIGDKVQLTPKEHAALKKYFK